jgi:hypothetical protein
MGEEGELNWDSVFWSSGHATVEREASGSLMRIWEGAAGPNGDISRRIMRIVPLSCKYLGRSCLESDSESATVSHSTPFIALFPPKRRLLKYPQ